MPNKIDDMRFAELLEDFEIYGVKPIPKARSSRWQRATADMYICAGTIAC